ncbi:hypothetical protein RCL1_004335 [Eukaryota sp. TZLM3-RCL]
MFDSFLSRFLPNWQSLYYKGPVSTNRDVQDAVLENHSLVVVCVCLEVDHDNYEPSLVGTNEEWKRVVYSRFFVHMMMLLKIATNDAYTLELLNRFQ